jgi:DNA-binding transcriptional LysR family regulator
MKIQHLRFFAAVVDCGGVVKAAERLSVSQPAVSAGLKALEHELGQPLFERAAAGRRLHPTSRALVFHQDALDILRKCEAARAQFQLKEVRPAKLRVGILQTIASRHIASFAAALARQNPELRLQLREGGPIRIADWLRHGHIDAAWTVVDKDSRNARSLWREPFVVLAGRTHHLGRNQRAKLTLAGLDGENLVLRTSCEMPRGKLWPESVRMRVVARAERDELALRLVAGGFGIAIAPQSLATEDVVTRRVSDLDVTRSVGLKWRTDLPGELLSAALHALSTIK